MALTTGAVPARLLTMEEYLVLEAASDVKHEYVDGELYAQSGVSKRHNRICTSIVGHLLGPRRRAGCAVMMAAVKLRVGSGKVYYPDVMVVCDPADLTGDPLVSTSPCLVVEVSSDSTEGIDRREKLLAYRGLPGLRTYLIVSQHERLVDWHWRDDQDAWWRATLVGSGTIQVPCLGTEMSLDDVYQDVLRHTGAS